MILENIKNRTLENHQRLEQSSLLMPITQGTITKENYIRILKIFYGFFSPLEQAIAKQKGIETYLPDHASRRKSELLLNDLRYLTQSEETPVCKDLPTINSLGDALGCLYVMEGSTLGGRIVSKVLKEKLDIDQSNGATFFNGYGPETGSKWKKFQEALVAYSTDTTKEDAVIDAADTTFLKFREWVEAN